jgi:hypothetical protein
MQKERLIKVRDVYSNSNADVSRNFSILIDVLDGMKPKDCAEKYNLLPGRSEHIAKEVAFRINLFYGRDCGSSISDVRADSDFLKPIAESLLKDSFGFELSYELQLIETITISNKNIGTNEFYNKQQIHELLESRGLL